MMTLVMPLVSCTAPLATIAPADTCRVGHACCELAMQVGMYTLFVAELYAWFVVGEQPLPTGLCDTAIRLP